MAQDRYDLLAQRLSAEYDDLPSTGAELKKWFKQDSTRAGQLYDVMTKDGMNTGAKSKEAFVNFYGSGGYSSVQQPVKNNADMLAEKMGVTFKQEPTQWDYQAAKEKAKAALAPKQAQPTTQDFMLRPDVMTTEDILSGNALRQSVDKRQQAIQQMPNQGMENAKKEEERLQQPIYQTNTPADQHVVKTQGQWEGELAKSVGDLVDPMVSKDVDNIIKQADNNFYQTLQQQASRPVAGAGQIYQLPALKQANEASDPEKALKALVANAESRYQEYFSQPETIEKIEQQANALGISPDDYINKVVAPQIRGRLENAFNSTQIARYVPKNTLQYLMGGIGGSLATAMKMATMTRAQRQYEQQGVAQYQQQRGGGILGTVEDAARMGVEMATDPLMYASGGAAGALTKAAAGTKFGGKILGDMGVKAASRFANGSVAQRMFMQMPSSMMSGGLNLGLYEGTSGVVNNYSTGDDTSLGNTAKVFIDGFAHGGVTGGILGMFGSMTRGLGANIGIKAGDAGWTKALHGAEKAVYNLGALGVEGLGFHSAEQLNNWLRGEHTDETLDEFVKGSLEGAVMAGVLKLTSGHNMKDIGEGLAKGDISTRFTDRLAKFLSPDINTGLKITDEDRKALSFLGDVDTVMKSIKTKEDAAGLYKQVMENSEIPFSTKQKFSAFTVGEVSSSKPIWQTMDWNEGDTVLRTRDRNGNVVDRFEFKDTDERNQKIQELKDERNNQLLLNNLGKHYAKLAFEMPELKEKILERMGYNKDAGEDDPINQRIVQSVQQGGVNETDFADAIAELSNDMKKKGVKMEDTFVKSFAEEYGMSEEDLMKVVNKDYRDRTQEESDMMKDFAKRLNDELTPPEQAHPQQSIDNGRAKADDGGPDEVINPDATREVTENLLVARQAYEDLLEQNGLSHEQLDKMDYPERAQYIYNNFGKEQGDVVMRLWNAELEHQGYFDRIREKTEEATDLMLNEMQNKGTVDGQPTDQIITIRDDAGNVYTLKGGDVSFKDGRIDPDNSAGVVIALDAEGHPVSLRPSRDIELVSSETRDAKRAQLLENIQVDTTNKYMENGGAELDALAQMVGQKLKVNPDKKTKQEEVQPPLAAEQSGIQDNAGGEAGAVNGTGANEPSATASSRIPKDEAGNKLYEQAKPEDSYDDLVKEMGEEDTAAIAQSEVADATKRLEKLQKQQLKGKTIEEKKAELGERRKAMEAEQKKVDYWNSVLQVPEERKRMAEEQRKLEEEQARKEEEARLAEEKAAAEHAELRKRGIEKAYQGDDILDTDAENVAEYAQTPEGRAMLLDRKMNPSLERRRKLAKMIYKELFNEDFEATNDINEVISKWLGKGRYLDPDSFGQALGWDMGVGKDAAKVSTMFAKKKSKGGDGMTWNNFIHNVWESDENTVDGEKRFTTEDIETALINMFQSLRDKYDLTEYQLINRIEKAEHDLRGEADKDQLEAEEYLQPLNEKEQQIIADVESKLAEEIKAAEEEVRKAKSELEKARVRESDKATDAFANDEAFSEPDAIFSQKEMGLDTSAEGVERRTKTERDALAAAEQRLAQLQSQAEHDSRVRGALENERMQTSFEGGGSIQENMPFAPAEDDYVPFQKVNDPNVIAKQYGINISDQKDQNNSPYVISSNNTIDFGHITPDKNITAAPIRMSLGDSENGYIHIENRHGEQIRNAGYKSVTEFVEYIANNFTDILKGESYDNASGGKNQSFLVQLRDEHNNTIWMQLSRDGSYWNVNSAGIMSKRYGRNKESVWSASEVQNGGAATADNVSRVESKADKESNPNGTTSNVSDGKDTKKNNTTQENQQKVAKINTSDPMEAIEQAANSFRESRLTKLEKKIRDGVIKLMKKAGIDISTDWEEGQKVINSVNNAKTQKVSPDEMKKREEKRDSEESNIIFDAAKKLFGTTTDIREAGYILPDGTMLDFSGRHQLDEGQDSSFLKGRRTSDHREIGSIAYEKDGNTPTGIKTDMKDFIERGAIRIDNNAGSINLYMRPTEKQKAALKKLISNNDGDVQIDFGNGWDSEHYAEYDRAKQNRVLSDIDKYYSDGIRPEGNIKFFRTKDGEAYGFVHKGKIYIDSRIATAETPVHEYTHLWAEAVRQTDEKKWNNIVDVLKSDEAVKSVWEKVKEEYPELRDDNAIAEEVLAQFSGKQGAERLRTEAERIEKEQGEQAAQTFVQKIKQALSDFWKSVADKFGMPYKDAESVADSILKDLLEGKKPETNGEERLKEQLVGEKGASALDKADEGTRMQDKSVAEKMEEKGKSAKEIWFATGWERGKDGKWRYEIPDFKDFDPYGNVEYKKKHPVTMDERKRFVELNTKKIDGEEGYGEPITEEELQEWAGLKSKINPTGFTKDEKDLKLSDFIDSEELFSAYPEIRDMKVEIEDLENEFTGMYTSDGRILLDRGLVEKARDLNFEESLAARSQLKDTIIHETQHAIQDIEGFAKGDNPHRLKDGSEIGSDAYNRSAGEVEARNVEKRRLMGSGTRRKKSPESTEDVSREDQHVYEGNLSEDMRAGRPVEDPMEAMQKAADDFRKEKEEKPVEYRESKSSEPQPVENRGKVAAHVNTLKATLGEKINVVDSVEGITNEKVKKDVEDGKKVMGWYDPKTGQVSLYMPNIPNSYEAEKTVWHETVGHKGMRELLGEEGYRKYMMKLWVNGDNAELGEYVKNRIAKGDLKIYDAVNEWLGEQAEKEVKNPYENASVWQKVREAMSDALRKVGYKMTPSIMDVKYMMWLSEQNKKGNVSDKKKQAMIDKLMGEKYDTNTYDNKLYRMPGESTDDAEYRVQSGNGNTPISNMVRQAYRDGLYTKSFPWEEAHYNYMAAYKRLQDAIAKGHKIPDHMNALMQENELDSKVKAAGDVYVRDYCVPYQEAINKCIAKINVNKPEEGYQDLEDYMYMKTGLQVNRQVYVRDWLRDQKSKGHDVSAQEQEWYQLKADMKRKVDNGTATLRDYYTELDEWIKKNVKRKKRVTDAQGNIHVVDATYVPDEHDASGLTSFAGAPDGKSYDDADILDRVMNMENQLGKASVDKLWGNTKRVTDFALDTEYAGGMASKESIEAAKAQYDWYLPLRGFNEETAEDMWSYMNRFGDGTSGSILKDRKGRTSRADTPIATAFYMGEQAIKRAARNQVKQAAMRFFREYTDPTDKNSLITEADVWVHNIGTQQNPDWVVEYPNITPNATADQIAQEVANFKAQMEAYRQAGTAKKLKTVKTENIPYRFENSRNVSEHIIEAKVNGESKLFIVNDNPRAAQALNGQLKPQSTKGLAAINRFLSQAYTSWSPTFVARNAIRDVEFASSMLSVKEGWGYTGDFSKNYAMLTIPVAGGKKKPRIFDLFMKHRRGTLDVNDPVEKMFKEFIENGGVTGYVQENTIDKWHDEIMKGVGDLQKGGVVDWTKDKWHWFWEGVEKMGESVENAARFATYMTSRQGGKTHAPRTVIRAVADAKEVSVNFNRKGAGWKTSTFKNAKGEVELNTKIAAATGQYMRETSLFYNATVQGIMNSYKNAQKNPAGFAMKFATPPLIVGALISMFNQWVHNTFDDPEKTSDNPYADLAEYDRRGNLCIYLGNNNFFKLPLSLEHKAFYGLGDIAAGLLYDPKLRSVDKPLAVDVIHQLSTYSPVDYTDTEIGMSGVEGRVIGVLTPAFAKPFFQAHNNMSWTGRPIQKENKFNGDKTPEYQKAYEGKTTEFGIDAANMWHQWWGGDEVRRAGQKENVAQKVLGEQVTEAIGEYSPAKLQYLIEQGFGETGKLVYGGLSGAYKVGKDMYQGKSFKDALDMDEFNTRMIPVGKAFFAHSNEQQQFYRAKTKYFRYLDKMKDVEYADRQYTKQAKEDPNMELKKQAFESERAYKQYQTYKDDYKKRLDTLYKEIKEEKDDEKKKSLKMEQNMEMQRMVNALDSIQ